MQPMIKTFALCALALGFSGSAFAQEAQQIVVGPSDAPVRSEKFGTCVQTKWTTSQNICAPSAPKVVEAAPPPPPPAPEPVSKLAREQLTIYFGFNKDALTQESKDKLDQISDAVNNSPKVVKVDIVGYTDQIGSNSYNNKLSVRRAESVKKYLDSKTRIPAEVEGLRGRGKEDPVVNCSKAKKRKEKIACMAKDRRVEIEFEFHQR